MRPILLVIAVGLFAACKKNNGSVDAFDDGCKPGTGSTLNTSCDPGFTQTSPNTPDTVEVTFSGETLGQVGLPFHPVTDGDPVFVDGWNVSFDEILVVLGNFTLSPDATANPDQSVISDPVAKRTGPYVVDMHKPQGFVGKDGAEPAGGLFAWDTTTTDGSAFDTSQKYAFSYDTVPAPAVDKVANVNLTSDEEADYDLMAANGWSKLYRGTATYAGAGTYPDSAIQAKFDAMPKTIHFYFGWNDGTHNLNCINPDNGTQTGEDLGNRGIVTNTNGAAIAQVTLHVDHAFWDKLKQEGANLRFDPLAAWAQDGTDLDLRTLTHPLAATFADGTPLPDRAQYQNPSTYTPGEGNVSGNVVLDPNGVTTANVVNIADFMAFSAQSQMHLNADGLCYIVGQQAADPFYNPGIQ